MIYALFAEVPFVAVWHETDMPWSSGDVRFSNRPVGVKRFQTIHGSGVDVSRGLVLLFGIGTPALVWELFSQEV